MSKTIDERVVSMEFDNKNFEKNVGTTMTTLDKLKQALKFDNLKKTASELTKHAKSINFNPLEKGIDTIQSKFHGLGLVANRVLTNMVDDAYRAGKNIIKSITIEQPAAGWEKYNKKTQSVQTIMNSTGKSVEEVNRYLEKLQWFSDETSYSFTDMTDSLGKFTSAGADIDKVIPMITGIANATAFAGQGAAEFSRVIYNLNQAYGSGALQLMDWKSVENANVSSKQLKQSFIDTAKAMGILNKEGKTAKGTLVDIASFNTTLQEKWLTGDVMEATFTAWSEYSDAIRKVIEENDDIDTVDQAVKHLDGDFSAFAKTAFEAAQQAKTFSEAIDATKDAVSSQWSRIWESIFGNKEQATELWTDLANGLYEYFAAPLSDMADAVEDFMTDPWTKTKRQIEDAGFTVDEYYDAVKQEAKESGIFVEKLLAEAGGDMDAVIKGGSINAEILQRALGKVTHEFLELDLITGKLKRKNRGDDVAQMQKALVALGYDLGKFGEKLDGIDGKFGPVTEKAVKAFQEANDLDMTGVMDEATLQKLKEATDNYNSMAKFSDEVLDNLSKWVPEIGKMDNRTMLIESFKNLFSVVGKLTDAFKGAWREIFPPKNGETMRKLVQSFYDFTQKLNLNNKAITNIGRTLKGVFAILDLFLYFSGAAVRAVMSAINFVLSIFHLDLLDVTGDVGDLIVKLRDWIKESNIISTVVNKVGNALLFVGGAVKDWVVGFANADDKIGYLKQTLSNMKEAVVELGKEIYESARNVILGFWDGIKDSAFGKAISTFIGWCKGFIDSVKKVFDEHSPSKVFYNIGKYVVDGFWNGLKAIYEILHLNDILNAIKKFIKNVFDGVKNFVNGIDWGGVMMVGLGISSMIAVLKVINLATELSKAVNDFTKGFKNLTELPTQLTKAIKSWNDPSPFKKAIMVFKAIIALIGTIVLSIVVLSFIPEDKLWRSVAVLGVLSVLFVGLMLMTKVLAKNSKKANTDAETSKENIVAMAKTMANIMKGIVLMVVAIKILSTIDNPKNMIIAAAVIAGLVLVLSVLAFAISKIISSFSEQDADKFKMVGKILKQFTRTIASLALVMFLIGKMNNDKGQVDRGAIALMAMMGALLYLVHMSSNFNESQVKSLNAFTSVLQQIGKSILMMGLFIFVIGKMKINDMLAGLGAMMVALAMIALIAKYMSGVKMTKGIESFGVFLMKLSSSFLLLAVFARMIGGMSWEALGKAGAAIGVLSAIAVGLMAVAQYMLKSNRAKTWENISKFLLSFAGAIAILAVIIRFLGGMKQEYIDQGLLIVAGLAAMMTLMLKFLNNTSTGDKLGKFLLGFAGAIAIISVVIWFLGTMNPEEAKRGLKCVAILSALMAGLLLVCRKAQGAAKSILALAAVIAVMAGSVYLLSLIDEGNIQNATVAMGILSGCIDTILICSAAAKGEWKSILSLAALVAVMGLVMALMGEIDTNKAIPAISAMASAIDNLAIATGAIGAVGKYVSTSEVANGMLSLGAVIGVGGALFVIVGWLDEISGGGITEKIKKGIEVLSTISGGLGECIGSFIGGLIGGITSGLSEATDNIDKFVGSMKDVSEDAADINTAGLDNVTAMLKIFGSATWQGLGSAITGFLGAEFDGEKFGKTMQDLVKGMIMFDEAIQGHNFENKNLDAAVNMALTFAKIQDALPSEGGIKGWIMGKKQSLGDFGTNIKQLGQAMVDFCEVVDGKIKTSAAQDVANMGSTMAQLQNALPAINGVWQALTGQKMSLSEFGTHILTFGHAMVDFCDVITSGNINQDAVDAAAAAGTTIAQLARILPDKDGWVQDLFGGTEDLGTFSTQITQFGGAMANLALALDKYEFDPAKAKAAADVGMVFADIGTKLDAQSGNWEFLPELGQAMVDFIDLYRQYVGQLQGVNTQEALEKSKQIKSAVSEISVVANTELKKVESQLSEVDTTPIASNAYSGMKTAVDNYKASFSNIGTTMISYINDGIRSSGSKITDIVASALSNGLTSVKNLKYNAYYELGEYIAKGLANGMRSSKSVGLVSSAGRYLGTIAENNTRLKLETHSPSKVFYNIGTNVAEGLANGMEDNSKMVKESGGILGNSAINSTKNVISRLSRLVSDGMDTTPTIRPVMDLSDVENGVGTIGRLLNGTSSIGLGAAYSINRRLNEAALQNGTTNDVIDAISQLRSELSNTTPGNTYNVNGITYDDGTNVANAIQSLITATRIERRA